MNDEDRGDDIVVHYDDDYDYFFLVCVEQSMLKTVPLTLTPDLAPHTLHICSTYYIHIVFRSSSTSAGKTLLSTNDT